MPAIGRSRDFDGELRFEPRSRARKRPAGSIQRTPAHPKRVTTPALRLVPKAGTIETAAVVDAALHARTRSGTWKEYVENMDLFPGEQLDIAG